VGVADQAAVNGHIAWIAAANVLMLLLGCGLLPFLRLARTRRDLLTRAPLGFAVGVAATGILVAELAVVGVPVGRVTLTVVSLAVLAVALVRLPNGNWAMRRPDLRRLPAFAVLVLTLAILVPAARLFAVKPLLEFDGWAIWATRAKALYEYGRPVSPVFTDPLYPALQHPLLLPALEALDARFMGTFDGTALHIQLFAFAIVFLGGAWTLLRGSTRPLLLAATLLAIVCAPTFFNQLQTNYADVPLAVFVALGIAALATWLRTGGEGLLPAAALFLAAAVLTKNEGEAFVLMAFVSGLAVARRDQVKPLLIAAAAVAAADLPWRIWLQVNDVHIAEYSLSNLFDPFYLSDHAGRVGPAARELVHQIWRVTSWSHVVELTVFALVSALVLKRFRTALFGIAWLLLSFGALVGIYWISTNPLTSNLANSSDRTIESLVIAGGLLVPVLLFDEKAGPADPYAPRDDQGSVRSGTDATG
jgi:hypothetical protein